VSAGVSRPPGSIVCPSCGATNIGPQTHCLICQSLLASTGVPGPPVTPRQQDSSIPMPEEKPAVLPAAPERREAAFCRNCGQPRKSGARFCTSCGHQFSS
jgi:hypothetical protein